MMTLYKKPLLCWYGKTLQEHGQKVTQVVDAWPTQKSVYQLIEVFMGNL